MEKLLLILIEQIEQCHTVLTKIYKLIAHYSLQYQSDISEKKSSNTEISVLDVADGDQLFTIDDACDKLGVTRGTLRTLRLQGLLPEVTMGKKGVRFRHVDVERLRKWYSVPKGKV